MAEIDTLLAPVLAEINRSFPASIERYCAFLRIPSISTDPAYAAEVKRAGSWLAGELASIGFETSLRETPGHPILVAHYPGPATGDGAPHLLYYGHYDVQPADPVDLWTSPPFEPAIVDGPHGRRVVARGAVDDKGQVMTFLEALRAWFTVHGSYPARLTILVEGEEETGSPSLPEFLRANREELTADVALITDTGSWNIDTPAITTMLRGLLYVEATLKGPSRDLHSGMYGGSALNPLNALTRILGGLHDDAGRVQIPAFYDRVRELPAAQSAQWDSLAFDEAAFLSGIGLSEPSGERGRPALQRLWSRPTCDINGIWGGYTGAGSKTVIASQASVKLSFRLVPDQQPEEILAGVKTFFEQRTPPGCSWTFEIFSHSPGIVVEADSPYIRAADAGLRQIYGKSAVLIGCGGSIPVVGYMHDILALDSVLVGFGLEDDCIHSPNEKFELRCLQNGILSHAAILSQMSRIGGERRQAA